MKEGFEDPDHSAWPPAAAIELSTGLSLPVRVESRAVREGKPTGAVYGATVTLTSEAITIRGWGMLFDRISWVAFPFAVIAQMIVAYCSGTERFAPQVLILPILFPTFFLASLMPIISVNETMPWSGVEAVLQEPNSLRATVIFRESRASGTLRSATLRFKASDFNKAQDLIASTLGGNIIRVGRSKARFWLLGLFVANLLLSLVCLIISFFLLSQPPVF